MDFDAKTLRIRALNDAVRRNLAAGQVFLTQGIRSLPLPDQADILNRVSSFDEFGEDNDPWGEHDCACFEHGGETIFWKIDYYDLQLKNGSEDPSDPARTRRVLTVLLAEEY